MSDDKPNEDLTQTVRHRLSELPEDVWAGELADVACTTVVTTHGPKRMMN
jgi:hypothetical protein